MSWSLGSGRAWKTASMMDFMDSDDARAVLREEFRQYLDGKIIRINQEK